VARPICGRGKKGNAPTCRVGGGKQKLSKRNITPGEGSADWIVRVKKILGGNFRGWGPEQSKGSKGVLAEDLGNSTRKTRGLQLKSADGHCTMIAVTEGDHYQARGEKGGKRQQCFDSRKTTACNGHRGLKCTQKKAGPSQKNIEERKV